LGAVLALLVGAIFLLGVAVGYGLPKQSVQAAAPPAAPPSAAGLDLGLLREALDLLYGEYYGALPATDAATYAAIRGVVGLLDDPNTSFLTPDEASFFRSNLAGSFEGIGARVAWDEVADTLVITEPFENQPAWNAGLRRQDWVLAVDGEPLTGVGLSAAVARIRGPKGSEVTLTIRREAGEPFDVVVVRDLVAVPTITTDSLGPTGDIAYVRLTTFNENAGALVREAVRSAVQHNKTGLVFDLRGNTGGLLREAVKVSNVFLEDETVLFERFSDGRSQTYTTDDRAITTDLPVVVLVDGGSASASEIVAGALQDTGRARLIGTTTYGKGSVQLPHTLSDGSIMRITIARWHTPNDRTIDGTGLTPDHVVEMPEDGGDSESDPQLQAAIDYLLKLVPAPQP
jgi:carboxyl-terminal processing protease